MGRILVVDDHDSLRKGLVRALNNAGHDVEEAPNGTVAIERLQDSQFDVVLTDLRMGGADGMDVLRTTRSIQPSAAVILMTAFGSIHTAVEAMKIGAADYLTKPFSPQELVLRVAAILRRMTRSSRGDVLTVGPIEIDRGEHRVRVEGIEVDLTATEYKLLMTLVERRGRVQTRPQLLETVWEAQPDIQTRTVDMQIAKLRKKLGDGEGGLIETVRGAGYRFGGSGG